MLCFALSDNNTDDDDKELPGKQPEERSVDHWKNLSLVEWPVGVCGGRYQWDGKGQDLQYLPLETIIMRAPVSRSTALAVATSSVLLVSTWRLLQWRARKRAKETADRVKKMLRDGPLVRY